MTEEEEEMTLRAIRARVGELESSFRTSLEEDKAAATATAERLAKSPTPEDERMGNILGLRVIKKRLARRVAEILDSLGGCEARDSKIWNIIIRERRSSRGVSSLVALASLALLSPNT